MNKFIQVCLGTALLWGCSGYVGAEPASSADCRPLPPGAEDTGAALAYSDAVLWKITKAGRQPSYIFGTIHVSDPRITQLPAPVAEALSSARVFVMEALPEPEESQKLLEMMYFRGDDTLRNYLDDKLFAKAAAILGDYLLPPESIALLQPWAAFIIMSYPRDGGMPFDLQLLERARRNGAQLHGLETLTEQGRIFSELDTVHQVRLLLDTLCNYDQVEEEFESMKTYYLQRDLRTLYHSARRNFSTGERLYTDLLDKLLSRRNQSMVERMTEVLEEGGAFIAIGALHLPAADGVLSLLGRQGYGLTAVY